MKSGYVRFHRKLRYSIIAATLSIFFVSVTLIALFISRVYVTKKEKQKLRKYQELTINIDSKQANFGHIFISEQLEKEEYRSYQDSFGNYHLISNLGSKEHLCTGTCYCEETERRSTSGGFSTTIRGLKYLVATVATLSAISLAQKHFSQECKERMKNSCFSEQAIRSEVESCDTVTELIPPEISEDELEKRRRKESIIKCSGNCLVKILSSQTHNSDPVFSKLIQEESRFFGCDSHLLEMSIALEYDTSRTVSDTEFAQNIFQRSLKGHCAAVSVKEIVQIKGPGEVKTEQVQLCSDTWAFLDNPTVFCRPSNVLDFPLFT